MRQVQGGADMVHGSYMARLGFLLLLGILATPGDAILHDEDLTCPGQLASTLREIRDLLASGNSRCSGNTSTPPRPLALVPGPYSLRHSACVWLHLNKSLRKL